MEHQGFLFMTLWLRRRKTRPLSVLLAVAMLVASVNWLLGPRLYPTYATTVALVMTTLATAGLLIFGTIDSVRRRIRLRKYKKAVR